jgi:hypothetical protein
MKDGADNTPDISDIFQRRAEGRRETGARTFGEKRAWMEAARESIAPLKRFKQQCKKTAERQMTVAERIAILQTQDPTGRAVVAGHEGGLDDVVDICSSKSPRGAIIQTLGGSSNSTRLFGLRTC